MCYQPEHKGPFITNYVGKAVISYICSTSKVFHYMKYPISTYSGKIRFETILKHPNVQKRKLIFEKHKEPTYTTITEISPMMPYETIKNYNNKISSGYYSILTSI